jgi:biotin carboxyl carrier protein
MADLNGASRPVRVTIAGGPGGSPPREPIRLDGQDRLEPVERAGLSDDARARLVTGDGAVHHVVISSMPAAQRSVDGIDRLEVVLDGWRFEIDVEDEARAALRERATTARSAAASGTPVELRAIIPGRVVSVDVATGDAVETGGRLLVVEAMKMQNELRTPRAGTIARVAVGPGQTVERGDLLLVIE